MMNAGEYRHPITFYKAEMQEDADGFQHEELVKALTAHAKVKTFRGATLVKLGTDFEKATTAFFIRKPVTRIDRKWIVEYRGEKYTIEYLNDNDDKIVELQVKEVTH